MLTGYVFTGYGYLNNWELVKYSIDKLNDKIITKSGKMYDSDCPGANSKKVKIDMKQDSSFSIKGTVEKG
jgi:hypothetical protein